MRWLGAAGVLAILLLLVPSAQSACPQHPPDCYALLPTDATPEVDIEGILTEAGIYEQGEDTTDAAMAVSANIGQFSGPRFSMGDVGGVLFVLSPGQSDGGDRTHANVSIEVPEVSGLSWTNGTSRLFSFPFDGSSHYEALPFVLDLQLPRDVRFPFNITVHPGEPDEARASAYLLLLAGLAESGFVPFPGAFLVVALLVAARRR